MIEENSLLEQEFGFDFKPRVSSHTPGYKRVDIIIHDSPTYSHFDPEKVCLSTLSVEGCVESLIIHHPYSLILSKKKHRVCAGTVTLTDRKGKNVDIFTFGGSIRIDSQETKTLCVLESPAPILHLNNSNQIARILAEEVEILLAERRASWLPDIEAYEKQLAKIDPTILYVSCLNAIKSNFSNLQNSGGSHDIQLILDFIRTEIRWLHKQHIWLEGRVAPSIEELL